MSPEQTFLGISNNSIYLVDPRLPENKTVNSERQQYVSKTNFSTLATTEKGYVAFTPAKLNIDRQAEETRIITATGPYLIEWNLKRILQGSTILYKMNRYAEDVKAEEFRHESDKAVLVALSNGVDMTTVQSCRTSTKGRFLWDSGEAISGISCLGHGKYNLNKKDIVDSPY
ncbi:uncharacterized protein FFNC_15602 [Fusarium fujikuroi]|nr:uncharacterized protein FFNC_15602 [Fusarium fujikuroi]